MLSEAQGALGDIYAKSDKIVGAPGYVAVAAAREMQTTLDVMPVLKTDPEMTPRVLDEQAAHSGGNVPPSNPLSAESQTQQLVKIGLNRTGGVMSMRNEGFTRAA